MAVLGDLAKVERDPRVYDLFWEMGLHVGMDLPVYRSGKDVIAGVIATAESIDVAADVAESALASLRLVVDRG